MNIGIYRLKWVNCKFYYIGSSRQLNKRKSQHFGRLRRGVHENWYVQNTYDKYGMPEFEILTLCETKEELYEKEEFYLQQAKEDPFCTNILYSPFGVGREISEETRRKVSEAHKGKVVSEETRRKMGNAQRGKFVSEETRDKIRKLATGRVMSEETKAKLREANIGKIISEEHLEKLRVANLGEKNPMFGRCLSKHPKAKKVINTESGEIYGCAKEISDTVLTQTSYSQLKCMLNGSRKNWTPYVYLDSLESK